jgi:thiol-disulfide isomerase/thioredoxin
MNPYSWILMALCVLILPPASAAADDAWILTDMAGETHDVDELLAQGRNVTLVFWQTWCGPCKREAPGLAVAATEHAEGLAFFGVVSGSDRDIDDKKVRGYVQKYELPYPQIRDRDISLTKQYEVVATPTIIVLGPGREVLFRGNHPPESWKELEGSPSGR